MKPSLSTLLFAALAAASGGPASAQDYHSNDLTPAGSVSGKLAGSSSGRQAGSAQLSGGYSPHAVLLTGNALTAVDLNPATAYYSMATCMDDSQEGGWAYLPTGVHAVVWDSYGTSYSDLNPSGYNFSYCYGVHNGEQVGYAQSQSYFITASHAYCWHGTAASGVDLHSGTYPYSRALGCHDGEEVGYFSSVAYGEGDQTGYHTGSHAVRWAGTAASAVDLHPVGFDASEAVCTNGTQQGGWGYIALGTTHMHALLWNGDAASVVDLQPASGYTETRINAISATQQVGEGWAGIPFAVGSVRHALAWSGTADGVVDLNQYLPAGYIHGVATGVDASGNVVGYAYNNFVAGAFMPSDAVAVVFAPGAAPATQLASLTLSASNALPGDTLQGTVALGGAAPAGGVTITFLSLNTLIAATPAAVTIAEGENSASFSLPIGSSALTVPTTIKLYANDGNVSRSVPFTVTPVVKLGSITGNTVEGGFTTYGSVTLSIPAQVGGAVVTLASSNPSLVSVPASVVVPQGYAYISFQYNTAAVTVATAVPVTATFNGQTASAVVTLSPAPIVALAGLTLNEVVGGQLATGTVTLNNFPRNPAGAVITLASADTGTLQVPVTVTVPYGYYSASFTATTKVVSAIKAVSVNAAYNGTTVSGSTNVNPIPTVTIISASYDPTTLLFKVSASTSYANSILTYGTTSANGPIGTMQFELGTWSGAILMATAPTTATVWNSNGGQASLAVTVKGVASGGGGGGGGGTKTTTTTPPSTATTYKLTTGKTGKGTITSSPVGTTFAAGTVVTLTAVPDAGSPWIGWSGSINSISKTMTVTMNANLSLTANFK